MPNSMSEEVIAQPKSPRTTLRCGPCCLETHEYKHISSSKGLYSWGAHPTVEKKTLQGLRSRWQMVFQVSSGPSLTGSRMP